MSRRLRAGAGLGTQRLASRRWRVSGFRPVTRITNPMGAITAKYTIPRNTGVVTRDSAAPKPSHARCTGPRRDGTATPARKSTTPNPRAIPATPARPRHHKTPPITMNAAPSVRPKRRPSAAVNRSETCVFTRLPFPPAQPRLRRHGAALSRKDLPTQPPGDDAVACRRVVAPHHEPIIHVAPELRGHERLGDIDVVEPTGGEPAHQ